MSDEIRLLSCFDAAHVEGAKVDAVVRQLESWLQQLHYFMDVELEYAGLTAASAISQQACTLDKLLKDSRIQWLRKWDELQPANALANYFEERLILLLFGSYNAGKSSLCNFLAERFAAHGREVRYFYFENDRICASDERMSEGATETTDRMQGVCLGERLVLLDTPGLHSVTLKNAVLTQRFTDSSDGALWLTSSASPGQVQQLEALANEIHRHKPILPVVTRSDVIEEDEINGEICKSLRNKTPENRALQENDVYQRAQEKLRQLGIDSQLLKAPVSVSVHAARELCQTESDLERAGFLRLYAALLEMKDSALAYKQLKPAEVLLHHLQENVLGVVREKVLPSLAGLQDALSKERERLQQNRKHMLLAAWREIIPELPALMDEHAQDLDGLCAATLRLTHFRIRCQFDKFLADYLWPILFKESTVLSLPAVESDQASIYLALQTSVRAFLDDNFSDLLNQCEVTLKPLEEKVQQLKERLFQCEQQLNNIARSLRGGSGCHENFET